MQNIAKAIAIILTCTLLLFYYFACEISVDNHVSFSRLVVMIFMSITSLEKVMFALEFVCQII